MLHPRGSEYQTQFVIDGIPLTDNRSPSFGPEIEADDLDSMSIYTAGFPAEYGRKMGGVVELNTQPQHRRRPARQLVLSGGSYDTLGRTARLRTYGAKNTSAQPRQAACPPLPESRRAGELHQHTGPPAISQSTTNAILTAERPVHPERAP